MQGFMRMCEVVRRKGAISKRGQTLGSYPNANELFWHLVEKSQQFVITPTSGEPESIDFDWTGLSSERIQLDAPFETMSLELLDGDLTVPNPSSFIPSQRKEGDVPTWIHTVLTHEVAPRQFNYFVHLSLGERWKEEHVLYTGYAADPLVKRLIDRINTEQCGTEHVRQRIKISSGATKRVHTIRRIVHVRPKKIRTESQGVTGKQIDWTHRWWRRGHWRTVEGLGKNRSGDYCISGKTWVIEHTAGAPDAPVIKKTRLITQEGDSK